MFALYLAGIALGYLLLALVTTYVVVKLVGKRSATQRIKILAALLTLLVFWLIPFWDWLPTVLYHRHLCKTEAGVKIYRSVDGVEGFLTINTGELTLAEKWGYKYVDMYSPNGVRRPRKNESGGLPLYFLEPPSTPSKYAYKYAITRGLPWHAVKNSYTTYVISNGEVLGIFIDFGYTAADPNVSMSEWRKPWLNAYSCYDRTQRANLEKELVLKTLRPLQTKQGGNHANGPGLL